MFERLFRRKARIDERRREMALEVSERRMGQELLKTRLDKFLDSEKAGKAGGPDSAMGNLSALHARPDNA